MTNYKNFTMGMLVLPLALLGLGIAFAGSATTPHTFTSGSTALASEVNANFAALESAINDNDQRIATLEMDGSLQFAVHVEDSGILNRSFSASGTTVTSEHSSVFTGAYIVEFGEDVSNRFFQATIGGDTGQDEPGRSINVVMFGTDAVFVTIRNSDGTLIDSDFFLTGF